MSDLQSVMEQLRAMASEKTRRTYIRHGSPADRVLGVSTADMKTIAKTIRGRQDLALELYETGLFEAMYMAGMVARGKLMTREQLNTWADQAAGMNMISEYTVPWVTVENSQSRLLANEWIGADQEHIASSGWCTYSGIVATTPDKDLDFVELESLLSTLQRDIHTADNRVKSTMNGFLISLGAYVKPMTEQAKDAAQRIGPVSVDVGDTACKVPLALDYIAKIEAMGRIGQKRKTIRC